MNILTKNIATIGAALGLSLAMTSTSFASNYHHNNHNGDRFVGHYIGYLDLSPLEIPRLEDIQIVLHKDGTATFVTDEDGEEMESSGYGTWKQTGKNRVIIGATGFRVGERICTAISPPDGRIDNRCNFEVGINVKINKKGKMTGMLRATVVEVNEDTREVFKVVFPADVPLVDVRRSSVHDYNIP